ncbi:MULTISPECIES: hypothetical protein [Enterobacteriaceae]|uniref:Uncharacterized protein n=1 Tax=Salmonella enterica subsp. enterica serovar Cubana TaxID=189201 RepID=A0A5W5V950_SALET|nr:MULTISPECIES: hypothetical protein [Enterobacteriaceae]AHY14165.1 hypothetical protein CFNIH1_22325 [Citrobacter freundii CFNIH1]EAA7603670.1 hypothetical protein [Salmonella enterica subsp. enterica]EAN5283924.1 hypothetical protein [Salmonella enterica]EBD3352871.1 hypothetical protein [Salmonella enterica subsp. enterica serovar Kentucky]EBY8222111.1 hypothetical protein [Salmonella enterica subsp. enterica serovar Muenster]ECU8657114.1 hypothetical protein [Salmonella enterica subsp. e
MNYMFEESLSENMATPDDTTSIHVLNAAYAVLARTLNDKIPGFSDDLLANLDRVYAQNEGQQFTQLAIAQLAIRVKKLTDAQG